MDLNFFADLQASLEQETLRKDEIRATVKELDRACRKQNATLNQIHADPTGAVPKVDFEEIRTTLKTLKNLIPENEFYKYNDLWSRSTQQAVFLVIFYNYLEQNAIVNIIPAVEQSFDEDILHAYISLISELSRLCVNSVTVGDYERPLIIAKHVKDLSAGFSVLNLKNDMLRKRFDGIKYDVKKIEEVVYDITLRGLHKPIKRQLDSEEQDNESAKLKKMEN